MEPSPEKQKLVIEVENDGQFRWIATLTAPGNQVYNGRTFPTPMESIADALKRFDEAQRVIALMRF